MSDDISTALHGFADAQRRATDATAIDLSTESGSLARRVSRRRAVRAGSVALTAAAVVGGVVVGTLLSGSRTPAPPALTVPTPIATTTSTPTPTATPTTWALRDAEPLAPGMLEATGDGWVMLGYRAADKAGTTLVPATTYLLSPDGQPFVVPAADLDGWYVMDWLPGSGLVLALGTDGLAHVLDLVTGDVGPGLVAGNNAQFADDGSSDVLATEWGPSEGRLSRVGADGGVRASTAPLGPPLGSAAWVQSPDRTQIVVNEAGGPRAVATDGFTTRTLSVPYPERLDACRARMWADDAQVLMECTTGGATAIGIGSGDTETWLAPVDGGDPRQVVGLPTQERVGGVWRVGDRLVAGSFGPSESAASWWEITDDGVEPLSTGGPPELEIQGVRGSEILATLRPLPTNGAPATASLVAIDPVQGTTRTVVAGDPAWYAELTVTPSRFAAARD
jgi:hypothetical protein